MGVTGKLWLGSVSVALHWEFRICISYKMLDELFIISCFFLPRSTLLHRGLHI